MILQPFTESKTIQMFKNLCFLSLNVTIIIHYQLIKVFFRIKRILQHFIESRNYSNVSESMILQFACKQDVPLSINTAIYLSIKRILQHFKESRNY
jgi:hypothetical protein